jgi:2-phosphoglycerate kinase
MAVTTREGPPPWKVLLLGGSSGTGKSTVAPRIGRRLGVSWVQVDDIRLGIQRITSPDEQPALRYFLSGPSVWNQSPEILRDRLIAVGRIVSRSLEDVVAHHVVAADPIILEGDGILPETATEFARQHPSGLVRAAFLCEDDEEHLRASILGRGRGAGQLDEPASRTVVRMSWLYGQWLQREAERLRLPVVSARPRRTAVQRVLRALECR